MDHPSRDRSSSSHPNRTWSRIEQARLAQALALQLRGGSPLEDALERVAGEGFETRGPLLRQLSRRVRAGTPPAIAFKEDAQDLDPLWWTLFDDGEGPEDLHGRWTALSQHLGRVGSLERGQDKLVRMAAGVGILVAGAASLLVSATGTMLVFWYDPAVTHQSTVLWAIQELGRILHRTGATPALALGLWILWALSQPRSRSFRALRQGLGILPVLSGLSRRIRNVAQADQVRTLLAMGHSWDKSLQIAHSLDRDGSLERVDARRLGILASFAWEGLLDEDVPDAVRSHLLARRLDAEVSRLESRLALLTRMGGPIATLALIGFAFGMVTILFSPCPCNCGL